MSSKITISSEKQLQNILKQVSCRVEQSMFTDEDIQLLYKSKVSQDDLVKLKNLSKKMKQYFYYLL